ncbi:hypothetical protein QR680_012354 [Steinernema hermaphroditum]|uniref:Vacuolar protein sorting-associated protein 53 homolog n=1 Tax=Steinernema hermaphroditum TaxID=289476 RepID=A0AA39LZQ4_9BILA|nr:hypothetical protein QR680_012354 [Steinernema hermaphroditum]
MTDPEVLQEVAAEKDGETSSVDKVFGDDELPKYSDKVYNAIDELCTTELCRPDLDLTTHINRLFPTEQSLSQLDTIMASIENEISDLDTELSDLVETHGKASIDGDIALGQALSAMNELEMRIKSIRSKTQLSESNVQEMTRDIKQLDIAKCNLTASITTLHHLHILLTGVNSLALWTEGRRYADIAAELPTVLNVLQLFDSYTEVKQIRSLTEEVRKLKDNLSSQLDVELRRKFQTGVFDDSVTDMCRVVSVLGDPLKNSLMQYYIDQQLSEYCVLFAETEDIAWIDKIDQRYRWYVSKLTEFERSGMSKVFPPDWEMGRRITKEFCKITRTMLQLLMNRRLAELDWKLLAHAINHTIMFENLLTRRFPAKGEFSFEKTMWPLFDNYLDVFVVAHDKNLTDFLDGCATKIRNGTERPVKDTSIHAYPLPSSADMFLLLKKIITESSKLSSDPDVLLRKLIEPFRKCLRGYAHGCLTAFIPQTAVTSSLSALTGVSSSFSTSINASAAAGILQNFLRDDGSAATARLTPDQTFFTCCILATADWCAETALQLQTKLRERIPNLDFTAEMELYYGISNSALAVLVQDVECTCDAALQVMTKTNWSAIEGVGDESAYVHSIRKHLKEAVPKIRDYFSDRRKYFAHFCLKLATQLVNKFLGALFRCRSVSPHGAEQLLLDTHSLKLLLLNLPSIESAIQTKPPVVYTTSVQTTITKVEMILKIVMSDIKSPEDFIGKYVQMLPDSDSSELQKILEVRGLRRSEQTPIIQLYRVQVEGAESTLTSTASVPSSMQATFSQVVSLAADGIGDSSMRRLEKLVKKKL